MPVGIPESQLETWSKQGSITGSSSTYNAIRDTLIATDSPYYVREFDVFLQGSYGNDTNIYAESDVDVVIQLKSSFQQDITNLSEYQQAMFNIAFSNATYTYFDFKRDVLAHLTSKYGNGVTAGKKAITIPATSYRRKADVIVALEYRKYSSFLGINSQSYVEGIKFYNSSANEIINYPKLHSRNLTRKHQDSRSWLKPMVRILKNLRSRLEEKGKLVAGDAPSYYLEGLLYNVPSGQFGKSYNGSLYNVLNWIHQCDKTKLLCAHEEYYLLRWGHETCWDPPKCDKFLAAATELWNSW
jgi:hypothetical protein